MKYDVVLGGGLAGLYYAYRNGDRNTLVIEKDKNIGGLAKTISYKGFSFDLGGHRFFTKKEHVLSEFTSLFDEGELVRNERISKIFINGKYVRYPLDISAIRSLPPKDIVQIVLENVFLKQKSVKQNAAPQNFKEDIIQRFGKKLFDIYFKGYTKKAIGLDCSQISADWSRSRIGNLDWKRLALSFFQKKNNSRTIYSSFYYPKKGIGALCDTLAQKTRAKILTQQQISGCEVKGGRIQSFTISGETYAVDRVISTIPLHEIGKLLKIPSDGLHYRSLIVVTFLLDRERMSDAHWIYFPEKNIIFTRLHEPKNWSEALAPKGMTSICLEILCSKGDEVWNMPLSSIKKRCCDDLSSAGFRLSSIIGSKVIKVPDAYPVWDVGYGARVAQFKEHTSRLRNLRLIGRTGAFDYINMDQVIEKLM